MFSRERERRWVIVENKTKKASHREHFLVICSWRVEQIATQDNDALLQGHSEVIVLC